MGQQASAESPKAQELVGLYEHLELALKRPSPEVGKAYRRMLGSCSTFRPYELNEEKGEKRRQMV